MKVGKLYLQHCIASIVPALMAALLLMLPACAAMNLLTRGSWHLICKEKDAAEYKVLSDTSVVVTVKHASKPNFDIQIGHRIEHEMPDGQALRVKFEARAPESNTIVATIEKATEPFTRSMNEHVHLTPQWKEYDFTCFVPQYGVGESALRFMVGDHTGTIEIRDIDVELLPGTAFGGGTNLLTDDQIESRINRFRKGNLNLKVVDARNKPVAGVMLHIQQTRHQFLFGCNIFKLKPQDQSAEQLAYQKAFLKVFNYATLPFYWGAFEREQGHPDFERLDAMAKWCREHNVTAKGHPLVWHMVYPSWAPADPDQTVALLHQRVTDIISHYKGVIDIWDIVNEATAAPLYQKPNGETQWIKRDGPVKVVETVLSWARQAGEGAHETFAYNDYQTNSQTLEMLSTMEQDKQLPDVIGIQSHMHQGRWPMLQLWSTCERFAQFQRPIHFTETTVLSGPTRMIDWDNPPNDWTTTPEDERQQADYVEHYYKVLFSHPAVQAITWWDLSDKDAWVNAPAGLLRKDLSPKPAYDRIYDLIHKQWWSDMQQETDKTGSLHARVFYGDYTITATAPGGLKTTLNTQVDSSQSGKSLTIRLP